MLFFPIRNGPQPRAQQSNQRGRANQRSQSPTTQFNVRIQHNQKQLTLNAPPIEQNLQSIEQSSNGPPDLIEQPQSNQNSIARPRSQSRQGRNTGTIAKSRRPGLFGPPQQFSPLPQQQFSLLRQQQPLRGQPPRGQSPRGQPELGEQPPRGQPQLGEQPPNGGQRGLANLPLPTPDLSSNSLTNDLQSQASSGQINVSAAPAAPAAQQSTKPSSNRLLRKVIRKKAKAAAYQDRNSLPLEVPDKLMSSASESIEHLTEHRPQLEYVPALPVENGGNFGTRLSKSA